MSHTGPAAAKSHRPVTIGLPFSDQPAEQFELAVRSIFAQSSPDWELILVADGPSRNVERARRIDDPRVTFVEGEDSRGLASRLNEIAARTTTDVLFRMDADDIMHPDRVAVVRAYLDAHTDVDLVGTRATMIDEHDEPRGLFRERPDVPSDAAGYLRSNAFSHPTVAARTAWFRAHPYDESLKRSQDKALWLTSHADSVFVKLPEQLLYYRVDSRLSARPQATSSHYDRVLLARYGRGVDPVATRRLLLESAVKQRVFGAMIRLGGSERLYRRKYEVVGEEALAAARVTIGAIAATPVPGWEHDAAMPPAVQRRQVEMSGEGDS